MILKCPNCGNKVKKNKCENCHIKFVREKNDNQKSFIIIIAIGLLLIGLVLIYYIYNNKTKKETNITTTTKQSLNKGSESSSAAPTSVGYTSLATYCISNDCYDVDVLGIRFLHGDEVNKYVEYKENLKTIGFEYKVTFNDLNNIKSINPILNTTFRLNNGRNFIKINGVNTTIEPKSIYVGNNIKNTESANVKVIYQIPYEVNEHMICLGYYDKKEACFKYEEE